MVGSSLTAWNDVERSGMTVYEQLCKIVRKEIRIVLEKNNNGYVILRK